MLELLPCYENKHKVFGEASTLEVQRGRGPTLQRLQLPALENTRYCHVASETPTSGDWRDNKAFKLKSKDVDEGSNNHRTRMFGPRAKGLMIIISYNLGYN